MNEVMAVIDTAILVAIGAGLAGAILGLGRLRAWMLNRERRKKDRREAEQKQWPITNGAC